MLEHDANLLVAPFHQPHFVPRVIAAPGHTQTRRGCPLAAQGNASPEVLFFVLTQRPVDFHQICLLHSMALCRCDQVGELTVVGEKNQPLTVIIQTPYRIHSLLYTVQQVEDRCAPFRVMRRAHHAIGFVQGDVDMPVRHADQFAIELYRDRGPRPPSSPIR